MKLCAWVGPTSKSYFACLLVKGIFLNRKLAARFEDSREILSYFSIKVDHRVDSLAASSKAIIDTKTRDIIVNLFLESNKWEEFEGVTPVGW